MICSQKVRPLRAPSPLECEVQNGYLDRSLRGFYNQFIIIFDVNGSYETPKRNELSFGSIRDWICDTKEHIFNG